MSSQNVTQVLGIVVLARGGDRQTLYLAPDDYASSLSSITPLGEQQEFQLGGSLRSIYLNVTSPSFVQGIFGATALFNQSSVIVQSDDAGEDGTLFDGAQALMQGLWPPSQQEAIFLANGTTITSPLGGYQYIPIDSVDPDEDISLEGAPSCTAWSMRNEAFYNSAGFLEKANQSASLLSALQPYLDGRPVNLENMWNVYDYMNVQFIHNATYAGQLPPAYMEQVRDLANWHEYNVFTDTAASGIGNIAGRVMLPSILNTLQRISNPLDGLKMQFSAISYQPFLSLMNMTGMFESGQVPPAIVEYAAALVLEVRQPFGGGEPVVRANFKNVVDRTSPYQILWRLSKKSE
ncbi:hypothetical protein EW026_g4172 [Hermanssonia centrifuga]|uniref:Uncharacterized protein n=1 Tax=Hermanssonia centrifuga TaxID=98765 RepID=A0A4S4KI06_9APHY|nr:hypothetical protein EW026_g4172 [Hermanssonia centrifuga]